MTEQKAEYKPPMNQSQYIEGYYSGYFDAVHRAILLVEKTNQPQLLSEVRMLLTECNPPLELKRPTVNGIPILLETWMPEGAAVICDGRKVIVLDMDHAVINGSPLEQLPGTKQILRDEANRMAVSS
jgi:hypothetical protein